MVATAAAPVRGPMRLDGEVSRVVDADALALWLRVSDVTRTPEWSAETRRGEWLGGATGPVAGARFRGDNRAGVLRWSRVCEVLVADIGREFTFRTLPEPRKPDSTIWTYRFEPVPDGTRVTLGYEIVRPLSRLMERLSVTLIPKHRDRRPDLAGSLDRLAAGVPQARLGQAHTAEGPVDLNAMWVMHHGFRRDLRDFALAVPATPIGDAATWAALARRWDGFSTSLHHHHQVEDRFIWPPLVERVLAAGDAEGAATLTAMAAEHDLIDPLLAACAEGFAAMTGTPGAAARDRLVADLERTRDVLLGHLTHEETGALPLVQRYLPVAEWEASEVAARKEFGVGDLGFTVPWAAWELPPAEFAVAFSHGGPLIRLIQLLSGRRFRRLQAAAFRHLPAA